MANKKETTPPTASKAGKELASKSTPKKYRAAIASAVSQADKERDRKAKKR